MAADTVGCETMCSPVRENGDVLICGVNWLGDSIMSMPAVQAMKRSDPAVRLSMLVKSGLAPLWRMHPDIDAVLELHQGSLGILQTIRTVKAEKFPRAYVLPHSFRSALIPFLARIPERIGMRGHHRDWMLTRIISQDPRSGRKHQVHQYLALMELAHGDRPEPPLLAIPPELTGECREWLTSFFPDYGRCPLAGILPGAAYGPAKRWPARYFADVGRRLVQEKMCKIVLFGSDKEKQISSEVAAAIGTHALDLAGETSVPELAAMLELCDVVIANDSGGMHLAAAVETNVVAIFGLTDPATTGPVGKGHRLLTAQHVPHDRDLARNSQEAQNALLTITPDVVYAAVVELLG